MEQSWSCGNASRGTIDNAGLPRNSGSSIRVYPILVSYTLYCTEYGVLYQDLSLAYSFTLIIILIILLPDCGLYEHLLFPRDELQ